MKHSFFALTIPFFTLQKLRNHKWNQNYPSSSAPRYQGKEMCRQIYTNSLN